MHEKCSSEINDNMKLHGSNLTRKRKKNILIAFKMSEKLFGNLCIRNANVMFKNHGKQMRNDASHF